MSANSDSDSERSQASQNSQNSQNSQENSDLANINQQLQDIRTAVFDDIEQQLRDIRTAIFDTQDRVGRNLHHFRERFNDFDGRLDGFEGLLRRALGEGSTDDNDDDVIDGPGDGDDNPIHIPDNDDDEEEGQGEGDDDVTAQDGGVAEKGEVKVKIEKQDEEEALAEEGEVVIKQEPKSDDHANTNKTKFKGASGSEQPDPTQTAAAESPQPSPYKPRKGKTGHGTWGEEIPTEDNTKVINPKNAIRDDRRKPSVPGIKDSSTSQTPAKTPAVKPTTKTAGPRKPSTLDQRRPSFPNLMPYKKANTKNASNADVGTPKTTSKHDAGKETHPATENDLSDDDGPEKKKLKADSSDEAKPLAKSKQAKTPSNLRTVDEDTMETDEPASKGKGKGKVKAKADDRFVEPPAAPSPKLPQVLKDKKRKKEPIAPAEGTNGNLKPVRLVPNKQTNFDTEQDDELPLPEPKKQKMEPKNEPEKKTKQAVKQETKTKMKQEAKGKAAVKPSKSNNLKSKQ